MPGPVVRYVNQLALAPADAAAGAIGGGAGDFGGQGGSGNALPILEIKRMIEMVDAASGVQETGADDERFRIDPAVLNVLAPGYKGLVVAAVARANNDLLIEEWGAVAPAEAGQPDPFDKQVEDLSERIKGEVKNVADLVVAARALYAGATVEVNWWGPRIKLSRGAAEALQKILEFKWAKYLSLLAAVPKVAVIAAVVVAAGYALGQWIQAANGEAGIDLDLYLWVVPWVESTKP